MRTATHPMRWHQCRLEGGHHHISGHLLNNCRVGALGPLAKNLGAQQLKRHRTRSDSQERRQKQRVLWHLNQHVGHPHVHPRMRIVDPAGQTAKHSP